MRSIQSQDYTRYLGHKARADRKNIRWQFTFDSWLCWWEQHLGSGWRELRGNKRGQYVMARKGDKGPYGRNNVECVTCGQNVKDAISNGVRKPGNCANFRGQRGTRAGRGQKLSADDATAIFNSTETRRSIAKRYNVSERLVSLIKNKQAWKSVL